MLPLPEQLSDPRKFLAAIRAAVTDITVLAGRGSVTERVTVTWQGLDSEVTPRMLAA
jgi:hypothetical protein